MQVSSRYNPKLYTFLFPRTIVQVSSLLSTVFTQRSTDPQLRQKRLQHTYGLVISFVQAGGIMHRLIFVPLSLAHIFTKLNSIS